MNKNQLIAQAELCQKLATSHDTSVPMTAILAEWQEIMKQLHNHTPQADQIKQEWKQWADKFDIDWENIEEHATFTDEGVTWKGGCNWSNKKLTKLPPHFLRAEGYFWCDSNQLTSLEGAPQKVEGSFWCDSNQLTSLEGAPKEVEGNFWCDSNQLTSLEGAPQKVEGYFWCRCNPNLTTFPTGLDTKGLIIVSSDMQALKTDAEKKGYNVRVY